MAEETVREVLVKLKADPADSKVRKRPSVGFPRIAVVREWRERKE